MRTPGTKHSFWNMSHRYLRKCQESTEVFFSISQKKDQTKVWKQRLRIMSFSGCKEVTKFSDNSVGFTDRHRKPKIDFFLNKTKHYEVKIFSVKFKDIALGSCGNLF